MIHLLHNLPRDKTLSWLWFLLNLRHWFVSRFNVDAAYDDELDVEIRCQALTICREKQFYVPTFLYRPNLDYKDLNTSITFLVEQKSKSALKLAAYFAKHLIFMLESQQNLRFDSKLSKFVYVCQNCIKLSPDRLLKFCLNSLISKRLFFEIKLDMLEKTRYHLLRSSSTIKRPFIYFVGFGLTEWFFSTKIRFSMQQIHCSSVHGKTKHLQL